MSGINPEIEGAFRLNIHTQNSPHSSGIKRTFGLNINIQTVLIFGYRSPKYEERYANSPHISGIYPEIYKNVWMKY